MRPRTRYLLAVTLVATAMCADRAVAAASRADLTPGRGIVERLSDGFRRTVATRPIVRQRCPWTAAVAVVAAPAAVPAAVIAVQPVCPACLPLPPPAC